MSAPTTTSLGSFTLSLAVKSLEASRSFYQKLGFEVVGGDAAKNWLVLRNGTMKIALLQGMLERNTLTFNPGWDQERRALAEFEDVRALQKQLRERGIEPTVATDEAGQGPGHFMVVDPDGNPVLVDQHV